MKTSIESGYLLLDLGAAPNPRQSRALRALERDESCGLIADSERRVRFSVQHWATVGEVPTQETDPEQVDIWSARQDHLASLLGVQKQNVLVDVRGHVGGTDCRFELVVDGERVGENESPIFGNRVLLPVVFAAQKAITAIPNATTRDAQIDRLARIRSQLDGAAEHMEGSFGSISVNYHPHLAGFSIRTVRKASLQWRPAKFASQLLSLTLDEIHDDGSRAQIDLARLSPDAPVVAQSSREYLLLSEGMEAAARAAKPLQNQFARDVEADPIRLLPEGPSYDDVDFAEYSPRVRGFEPILRPEREVDLTSGIEWYRKDSDDSLPILRLRISTTDGALVDIGLRQDEAPIKLSEAREASRLGRVVELGGQSVMPTEALLRHLEDGVAQLARLESQKVKPTDAGEHHRLPQPKRDAAVIADPDGISALPQDIDNSQFVVPWAELESIITPECHLKPHQREGVEWLWRHYLAGRGGVLLADEMGLGKTLQIACFLALQFRFGPAHDRELPSLVVCPLILMENWKKEIARYFRTGAAPEVIAVTATSMRSELGPLLLSLRRPAVVVMSYDTLARHQKMLLRADWATVILDESQNIKNPGTYRAAAARGLKRSFGICSTGTPVENRLRDLWTQFDFLSPGTPFGDSPSFSRDFEKNSAGPLLLREALRYPSIGSPVLHREKRDTLRELMPLRTTVHPIAMTFEQEELERQIVRTHKGGLPILGELQKLYQHPALLRGDDTRELSPDEAVASSPKLAKCLELLEEIEKQGQKAIVFTLWVRMQDMLRDLICNRFGLPRVHVINGDSNAQNRSQRLIDEFSRGRGFDVLIMSPLAAGAGLNVTAASHVIHYGRWWNPAKEDQATARAHRIGQSQEVQEHYLVLHHERDPTSGFDVKLDELVRKKRGIARDFLAPTDNEVELQNVVFAT
ncbi:MAG: DEAD/DEAH box helicase [Polyangiaceae bacterium]|nr:DEAD/DEAH box helicase [Polyangiaceae bacterium]